MKEFNPISPETGDCIICIDGPGGREHFYSVQEGNLANILSKYKKTYAKMTDTPAQKIAIYYVNTINSTLIAGIPIDGI